MAKFGKKYSPSFEHDLYKQWEEKGYFKPEAHSKSSKKSDGNNLDDPFVVMLPPPNVTGRLHLGHSIMIAIEDMMVRFHRMNGYETVWIPGTDHASISTQVVVEKQLAKEGKTKEDIGREAFLKRMRERVATCRGEITGQTKSMGASLDWSKEQFTMSEGLSRSVRAGFKVLHEKEKIYQSTYIVNRSPGAQTVLSDLEVEHKQIKTKLYYIRYFVQGKGDSISVATIRPETIFADVAIAVHPKDRRYKKWIGKNVLIPLINKPIPVIADEQVQIEFGTGALKITPAHSENDLEVALRHDLPIDNFAFDKDTIYTKNAGELFEGKNAYDFMENLVQYIEEIGNLEKVEDYETTVPFCERTGVRIEPLLSKQWFMSVREAADKVMSSVENQEVQIHPSRFEKIFNNWLTEIRPWCISRQLRRGHRIPVRYDENENNYVFDETNVLDSNSGKKSIISLIIFNLIADSRLQNPFSLEDLLDLLMTSSLLEHTGRVIDVYCDIYSTRFKDSSSLIKEINELIEMFSFEHKDVKTIESIAAKFVDLLDQSQNISSCGDRYQFNFYVNGVKSSLRQEEDVLDTWFSSALRPFSTLGWPEETEQLKKYYPNTVLETGYDIIFFRVIRMMLMGVEITNQMPFKNVYLHGLVRAEDGQKMSKSKGNGIDPLKLVEEYGADALRGALINGNTPGNDQKFSLQKIDYMHRFINKLWNASRFVSMNINASVEEPKNINFETLEQEIVSNFKNMNDYDLWMLGKLFEKVEIVTRYQKKFMLGESLTEVITLVRHEFCDWYIEIAKLQPSPFTKKVMVYVLGSCYKLLHPALPFVTEKLRGLLGFEGSISIQPWPKQLMLDQKNYRINMLMDMISQRRMLRQQVTKKPHEQVSLFVQGNKDIHLLVEDHQDLVRDIVKVKDILFIDEHETTPDNYSVAMLMDIKLGAKGFQEINWKEELVELEKLVKSEEQFLQRMRSTLSNPGFSMKAPPEIIEERKQKMEEVKSKISKLQFEISKIKMKHK